MNSSTSRFKSEVTTMFVIALLNIVFAALAIASGVQYIISTVSGDSPDTVMARYLYNIVAMVIFGLGISWLISTARIFSGIITIRETFRTGGNLLTDDHVTCLIVRMLAHYRENRTIIRNMVIVCLLGGIIFLILGVVTIAATLNSYLYLVAKGATGEFSPNWVLLLPALACTVGISVTSLASAWYFRRFEQTWDRRIEEIDQSEETLKKSLGLDGP